MKTYADLKCISKEMPDPIPAMAICAILGAGAKALENTTAESIEGNLLSEEAKENVVRLAHAMCNATANDVIAFIQRNIPHVNFTNEETGDQEDICPYCGSEIQYNGDQEIVGDGTVVSWHCDKCGAEGTAAYHLEFDYHFEVMDGAGKLRKEVN